MKGITIILYDKRQTGIDDFNRPVYEDVETEVNNVLIGEPTTEDVANELNLSGKHLAYTLAIPKGDTHDWENQVIEFWGKTWKSFGFPIEGIESNIPLAWNKKVTVERYE